jgi:hypothetical protein
VKLTRRELVVGAGASALAAAGVYELVDRLGSSPARPVAKGFPAEQHVLEGIRLVEDDGIEVLVPPLHHVLLTTRLNVAADRTALREAQARLEDALQELEAEYPPTPAGLGITVGWGLPYFRRYVPALAERHLPVDRRASLPGRPVRALTDAIRFPSDPDDVVLEEHDVAVLLRSDLLDHVQLATAVLRNELRDIWRTTSIRKGFAGGGFEGGQGLPKRIAVAAGVSGAELIPDGAELFLGFTSTQKHGLGPPKIANFETLGLVDLGPAGYFAQGTHMSVSHIFENLEAWYLNFDFRARVDTVFRPDLDVRPGTKTVRQAPRDAVAAEDVEADFRRLGAIGHSAAIQPTSRLADDMVAEDGTVFRKGTAIPQRADFNTLDNPFFWSAEPERDGMSDEPAAGVHFVVFNPSSDDFRRNRLAMDGVLPGRARLPLSPRSRGQGINSVLKTTHRQNFLVPPRRHRSFPLVELLT